MPAEILVVCYSRTGKTRTLAQELAARLKADFREIIDAKDRAGMINYVLAGRDAAKELRTDISGADCDTAAYKIIVAGTPVWAWNMTPAVRTWLENNKGKLSKAAFFTSAASSGHERTLCRMEEVSGVKACCSESFSDAEHKKPQELAAKLDAFAQRIRQELQ
ncbi:MAG: flavodoxin [Elusimicrobia bacterium]|nr:flavodoxin [Elusimicrobiota bacterium]